MKLFEYQAKELFRDYGIPTLSGAVVESSEEAAKVAAAAVVGIERILGSGAKRSSSPQGIVEEVPPSLEKLEQIPGRAPPPPQ